jgi:LmbE family N-acetylglucosaminyl deacetylase
MAHPDDAEFTCAGTLLRLAETGWDVHIATVTAGDCGSTTDKPNEIATIRTGEGAAAAKLCGATYHCLWEPDGRVVYDRQSIQKTIDLFRMIAPTLVITMPLSDYHVDHEITGQLGRAASFVYAAPNASHRPLLPGSVVPHLYYSDGHGGTDHTGRPVTPTTYVDISAHLEKKADMLACHASQREWLRKHNGVDEFILAMKRIGKHRGEEVGTKAAEAFVQHRGQAYPTNDLLAELFPMPSREKAGRSRKKGS